MQTLDPPEWDGPHPGCGLRHSLPTRPSEAGEEPVSKLWRTQPARSLLGLVAILLLYFTAPIEGDKSALRLTLDIFITVGAVVVVAMVTIREFRRLQGGEA